LTNGISRAIFGEPAPLGHGDSAVGVLPQGASAPPTQPVQPGPQQDPTSDGYPEVIYGSNGWLYFGYDIEGKCEPQQSLNTIVANLTKLRTAVASSGRTLVLFVAPDKSSVQGQNLPASYVGKDCASAADKQFWQAMDTFGATDPRAEINQASRQSGQSVYFPQDTHWNYTGGLIMVRELAEQIQPGVSSTWKVTKGPVRTGPADLPPMVAQSGTDRSNFYHLAPDGRADRDNQQENTDVPSPVTISTKNPVTGMVTAPTTMIGDSFTQYGAALLPAVFTNLTYTGVTTAASDPDAEAARMVASKVVVLEVVERNLVSGVSPFTSDGFINTISTQLAAHPLH